MDHLEYRQNYIEEQAQDVLRQRQQQRASQLFGSGESNRSPGEQLLGLLGCLAVLGTVLLLAYLA
jgi:hypothetical protein